MCPQSSHAVLYPLTTADAGDIRTRRTMVILIMGKLEAPNLSPYARITRRFSNHESCLLSRSHTYAIIVILDLKIHQSMWIHWPFFPKTWTKGHWPLDDLWTHVCWSHMCDSTQGSLCPSPMGIHQCIWIQWSILQITTYIHTYYAYILRTYYVQNEWSHSLLLNSVQARQKGRRFWDLPCISTCVAQTMLYEL